MKVFVFVPEENEEELRIAIGKAGAGIIGNYRYCSFVSPGTGWFEPQEGAKPKIGKISQLESVKEVKIEFVCDYKIVKEVIKVIQEVHPYEEVALDVFPLLDL